MLSQPPAVMLPVARSHWPATARAERLRRGIGDGLVRLSVGIKDSDDLIEDLDRALLAARAAVAGGGVGQERARRGGS